VPGVLRTDCGRFALAAPAELPARPHTLSELDYEDWQGTGIDYLVIGVVVMVHDDGHEVEFR
jgi:hypothetical protein